VVGCAAKYSEGMHTAHTAQLSGVGRIQATGLPVINYPLPLYPTHIEDVATK